MPTYQSNDYKFNPQSGSRQVVVNLYNKIAARKSCQKYM